MPDPAQLPIAAANRHARAVTTTYEAQHLIVHLIEVMDALLGTVEQETKLVRAGHMKEAAQIGSAKSDLARLYVADSARIKASRAYLSEKLPDVLEALRQRHDLFQALIQINLAVLAAVHAAPGVAAPAAPTAGKPHAPIARRA